jgi:WD40 repeat protein/serine/threonine protein kinase
MPSSNGAGPSTSAALSGWLEQIVTAFEAAWQRGERPAIDEYLAATDRGRLRVLVELVHADLECRLKAGEAARAEDYLRRYAELAGNNDLALDLIAAEYSLRRRDDAGLTAEGYLQRFPQYGPELEAHLLAVQAGEEPRGRPAEPLIDDICMTIAPAVPPAALAGAPFPEVAGYEILGKLGEGGMGVVYRARQVKLNRLVALKMILAGSHLNDVTLARFRSEAEAVARLQHPNIVQIYEVGEAKGRPYFSLELVEGGSLADRLTGTPLPPRQAAQLVQTLAGAVDAAHQRGIIHRDLKPANILLARSERPEAVPLESETKKAERHEPKVTDFGLAKQLQSEPGALAPGGQTQSGAILGTPSYMAPEQALGHSKDIGPVTDVYALGAILYELLTGRPPFRAATLLDTIQQVVNADPVPPSRLQPTVPRDVETIALKCLEKDRRKRYASGRELGEDLDRFLKGEPIQARPVGKAERVWRWCRRKPALATASGLAGAALVGVVTVAVSFGLYQAQTAKDLRSAFDQSKENEDQTRSQLAENYLDRALILCDREGDAAAGLLWMARALRAAPGSAKSLRERIRTLLASWAAEMPPLQAIFPHRNKVRAFSPDGQIVLTTRWDEVKDTEETQLWSFATGQPLSPLMRHPHEVTAVAFSPDGKVVLTGCADGTARLWSAASGQPLTRPLRHQDRVSAVAFSPDSKTVITGTGEFHNRPGETRLWSATTGQPLTPPLKHQNRVNAVAFSPDGKAVLTGSGFRKKGEARLWSAATGQPLTPPLKHEGTVLAVAFSPDGKTVLSGSADKTARLWWADTGRPRTLPLRHQDSVEAVAFSPNGMSFLTGSDDGKARLWSADTGQLLTSSLGHQNRITAVAFIHNGKAVLIASWDSTRQWSAASGQPLTLLARPPYAILSAARSPDGKAVLFGTGNSVLKTGEAQLWSVATGRPLTPPLKHQDVVWEAAFSPDGKTVLTRSNDGTARLWSATGQPLTMLKGWFIRVAFSPDGKVLLTGSGDWRRGSGEARLWSATTGRPLTKPLKHQGLVRAVAFSPDGKAVLTGSDDRTARLWSSATGQPLTPPLRHPDTVYAVAFSPDGRAVITGSGDKDKGTGEARLWSAATGQPLIPPLRHQREVKAVAFSPDGKVLLTGSLDKTARLWSAAGGRPLTPPLHHQYSVTKVVFSPDGKTILTGAGDRSSLFGWEEARLWSATTGQPLTSPLRRLMIAMDFTPEGKAVFVAGLWEARLWSVPVAVPDEIERIELWVQVLTGTELDEKGEVWDLTPQVWQQRRKQLKALGGPPLPPSKPTLKK